eukprot:TRINITY_DN1020_c0_g1_i3.p1 TRINITY_DN1020_c0_g1~~TRINITY_DN1020_c0_g1_i3.p1  ORF type:complete len:410 (+),score=152.30 TRINITY_DN1020_c0_g1_i3:37-1266(+)
MYTTAAVALLGLLLAYAAKRELEAHDAQVASMGVDGSGPLFSETYWEAREKFRLAAQAVPGVELSAHPIAEGSPYTMDIAYLKREGSQDLTVHLSGTHGVEGFAGSPIQIDTLQRWAADPASMPKKNVIIVHAYNPYGMALFRRFNEHNVDLNRNAFLDDKSLNEMVNRDPNIAGYEDLTDVLNPQGTPVPVLSPLLLMLQAVQAVLQMGLGDIKRALLAGQYHNPRGIYYGGKEVQPSHRNFINFVRKVGADKLTGRVVVVDVHTGLGPHGVDTLLVDKATLPKAKQMIRIHEAKDFLTNFEVVADGEATDELQASHGMDLLRGCTEDLARALFRTADVVAICQEFGTLHPVTVGSAAILENQAFNHAPEHQQYWAQYTRDAFYIRTAEWRQAVLRRGRKVMRQVLRS